MTECFCQNFVKVFVKFNLAVCKKISHKKSIRWKLSVIKLPAGLDKYKIDIIQLWFMKNKLSDFVVFLQGIWLAYMKMQYIWCYDTQPTSDKMDYLFECCAKNGSL